MSSTAQLLTRIRGFGQIRVGVLGDLMVDRFIYGDVQRISPEAPVPVVRVQRRTTQPGGAANVACNVLSLGGQCSLFGALGDDEAGREVRGLLSGVDLSGVVSPSAYPSTVKTRIVARSQHMLRIDEEDTAVLSEQYRADLLGKLQESLPGLQVLVVSDYAKGVLSPDFAAKLVKACAAAGVDVIVDPKPENAAAFAGARVMKPNLGEALRIAAMPSVDSADSKAMREVCELVRDRTGAQEVLVTAGARGLYVLSRDAFGHVPGHPREVFDVAGAGDSTVAAIALALGSGSSLMEAAELGNLVGSLAVGKLGVAAISADELRHEILLLDSEEAAADGQT
ncbi:bifunctional hydroxymethylpyrimidine kinase/phosphomethylpyrimidine kinase [bacterium]|nr:bifunctional hydroxymethylpyrimidine kinase/phosphomethylpyrimidine kinase [bacterium]